jgi:hypothetical protein
LTGTIDRLFLNGVEVHHDFVMPTEFEEWDFETTVTDDVNDEGIEGTSPVSAVEANDGTLTDAAGIGPLCITVREREQENGGQLQHNDDRDLEFEQQCQEACDGDVALAEPDTQDQGTDDYRLAFVDDENDIGDDDDDEEEFVVGFLTEGALALCICICVDLHLN